MKNWKIISGCLCLVFIAISCVHTSATRTEFDSARRTLGVAIKQVVAADDNVSIEILRICDINPDSIVASLKTADNHLYDAIEYDLEDGTTITYSTDLRRIVGVFRSGQLEAEVGATHADAIPKQVAITNARKFLDLFDPLALQEVVDVELKDMWETVSGDLSGAYWDVSSRIKICNYSYSEYGPRIRVSAVDGKVVSAYYKPRIVPTCVDIKIDKVAAQKIALMDTGDSPEAQSNIKIADEKLELQVVIPKFMGRSSDDVKEIRKTAFLAYRVPLQYGDQPLSRFYVWVSVTDGILLYR